MFKKPPKPTTTDFSRFKKGKQISYGLRTDISEERLIRGNSEGCRTKTKLIKRPLNALADKENFKPHWSFHETR